MGNDNLFICPTDFVLESWSMKYSFKLSVYLCLSFQFIYAERNIYKCGYKDKAFWLPRHSIIFSFVSLFC